MSISMNTSNRFLLSDYPHLASECFKQVRPVTKLPCLVFEDLAENQQAVCKKIKALILERLPYVGVYLFGSRIVGNWIDSSDYDIMITRCNQQERDSLKDIDFGVKTDLFFTPGNTLDRYVEIK